MPMNMGCVWVLAGFGSLLGSWGTLKMHIFGNTNMWRSLHTSIDVEVFRCDESAQIIQSVESIQTGSIQS